MHRSITLVWGVLLLSWCGPALAYVGPGLGAGTIGVILGFLASIVLAVIALFWYPIKRLFRRLFHSRAEKE